jgi:hypothetical protein
MITLRKRETDVEAGHGYNCKGDSKRGSSTDLEWIEILRQFPRSEEDCM